MSACDESRGWIAEAIDGELAADPASALAQHLGSCRECSALFRAEVASHRRLMERAAATRTATPTRATRKLAMPRRARPRRRSSNAGWLAAAAALALGAVVTALAWPRHPATPESTVPAIATVVSAEAGSAVVRDGGELPLRADMPLLDGDRLRARGALTVAMVGERTTVSSSDCDLTLSETGRRKRWELRSGAIAAEVEHQPADGGLTVVTTQAAAEVVGTRFTLRADPARSRLDVSEGRVRFARRDSAAEASLVDAGHSAEIDDRPPVPASPPAPTVTTRMIEDHEGPLRWTLAEGVAPMQVAIAAADGGHVLHLDYQPKPSDRDTYAQIAHPFTLAPGDRAIRLRIRVAAAADGANWNLQVRQRDRSCWWIGGGRFAELLPGWNEVEVPIPAKPRCCSGDRTPYDATAVAELMLSVCNESAAFDLDDVSVTAPP
jgi:ferric-dicitrate binding protein FerR (iron transport regulator)